MLEGYNIHVIRQPIVQNMRCTILLDTVSLIPMDLFILSMYICYWFEKSDMANVLLCKILFGALARIIPASSLQYLHAPVDSPWRFSPVKAGDFVGTVLFSTSFFSLVCGLFLFIMFCSLEPCKSDCFGRGWCCGHPNRPFRQSMIRFAETVGRLRLSTTPSNPDHWLSRRTIRICTAPSPNPFRTMPFCGVYWPRWRMPLVLEEVNK